MNFHELRLAEPIVRAVAACGYDVPTPIQTQAIPDVLAGRDLLGCARTGTGKTGAFALPILHRLAAAGRRRGHRSPRALVLAPTRELAAQIDESFRVYGAGLALRTAVIFGGVGQNPQVRALRQGVDIVVATPGRLLDLIGQRVVDLGSVEVLVLDEADRMLDMGFIRDIRRIAERLPDRRQTLLFSATMPDEIRRLADAMLRDPVFVQSAPVSTPVEAIDQSVCHVPKKRKPELLGHLLQCPTMRRSLVFTRTKHGADRLAKALRRSGIEADAIHGNKSQNQRTRALDRFKTGAAPVLVATDVASRGIDVDEITHVVNFDLPHEPETYVHRIGRTARAGSSGTAISFCDHDEAGHLRAIERLIRMPLAVRDHAFDAWMPSEAPRREPGGNGNGDRNRNGAPRGGSGPRRRRRRRSRTGDGGSASFRGTKGPRRSAGSSHHACA